MPAGGGGKGRSVKPKDKLKCKTKNKDKGKSAGRNKIGIDFQAFNHLRGAGGWHDRADDWMREAGKRAVFNACCLSIIGIGNAWNLPRTCKVKDQRCQKMELCVLIREICGRTSSHSPWETCRRTQDWHPRPSVQALQGKNGLLEVEPIPFLTTVRAAARSIGLVRKKVQRPISRCFPYMRKAVSTNSMLGWKVQATGRRRAQAE